MERSQEIHIKFIKKYIIKQNNCYNQQDGPVNSLFVHIEILGIKKSMANTDI